MQRRRRTRKHAVIMIRAVQPPSRTRRLETLVMWGLVSSGVLLMIASLAMPNI